MVILVYTKFNSQNIQASIGLSEYSYYFVLRKFWEVLQEVGEVIEIIDPLTEVDEHYAKAKGSGQSCIFLCFTAPHNSISGLACPSIPVFAWEYDTIPNESWGEKENNWVRILEQHGAAITHSNHSVEVVQKVLGANFPIIACPAPTKPAQFATEEAILAKKPLQHYSLQLTEEVINSKDIHQKELGKAKNMAQRIEITHALLQKLGHQVLEDIMPHLLYRSLRALYLFTGAFVARSLRLVKHLLEFKPKKKTPPPSPVPKKLHRDKNTIDLQGIIYTSVLNIMDGRKNFHDMVAAFATALGDKPNATLILKTTIKDDLYFVKEKVVHYLKKLPKFKCRIIVVGYYLDQEAYQALKQATTFYVNTSFGEGQCLPLMEYMAAGIPAIAPQATALKDYVDDTNAFVVKTSAVPTFWQHDDRRAIRTVHYRPDWYSLVEAYQQSYELATKDIPSYHQMGLAARNTLQNHCSYEATQARLKTFLAERLAIKE